MHNNPQYQIYFFQSDITFFTNFGLFTGFVTDYKAVRYFIT